MVENAMRWVDVVSIAVEVAADKGATHEAVGA